MDTQKIDSTLSKSQAGSSNFTSGKNLNDLPKKNLNEDVPYVPVAKKTTDDKINMPNPI